MKWWTRNRRKWLYGVCLAAMPVLIGYGAISQDMAELWIPFLGSILVPGMALANLSPDEEHSDDSG